MTFSMGSGMDDKVRENRVRRWAKRLGLDVRKSRARHIHVDDHGGYVIVDASNNAVVHGEKFNLNLDDVEAFLDQTEATLRKERGQ